MGSDNLEDNKAFCYEWMQNYERHLNETILEFIQAQAGRKEDQKEQLQSLKEAVEATNRLTLDFIDRYFKT